MSSRQEVLLGWDSYWISEVSIIDSFFFDWLLVLLAWLTYDFFGYPKTERDKAEMRRVSYAWIVGSLMYAMVCMSPDIAFVVGTVSRYMSNPGMQHWAVVKWILRYRRGTPSVYLIYGSGKPMLEGFTDSDMSSDVDSNWSTSGYVMTYARGSCVMAIKIAKGCGFVDHRGRVYGCSESLKVID